MLNTIKRNWANIQKAMLQSNEKGIGWKRYCTTISSGLSNAVFNKRGHGEITYFVENLPYYANHTNEYLTVGMNLSPDVIKFVSDNREFLLKIV